MCAYLHALTTCLLKFVNFRLQLRHTHPCVAIQWNLVEKMRGEGIWIGTADGDFGEMKKTETPSKSRRVGRYGM